MIRVYEINEIDEEVTELDVPGNNSEGWEVKRSWQIDENILIFEFRSDRNHLSVEIHAINEATDRENATNLQDMLRAIYTILADPKGGNA